MGDEGWSWTLLTCFDRPIAGAAVFAPNVHPYPELPSLLALTCDKFLGSQIGHKFSGPLLGNMFGFRSNLAFQKMSSLGLRNP